MPTTFNVISLGTHASIDPTEGNNISENASVLENTTFGSIGDPLYSHVETLSPGTNGFGGGTSSAYDTSDTVATDQFRIDGGVDQNFEGVAVYDATVTYADGSTATISAVVFQDTAGNTYLAPEVTANADNSVLNAGPITSLRLNSLITNDSSLTADRQAGNFVEPDGTVDGTASNDTIGGGTIDADGDAVGGFDGDTDVVYAGGGNDIIDGGSGADTVYGGTGDDSIDGGTGIDTVHGDAGDDIIDGGDSTDVVFGGAGNDTITDTGGVTSDDTIFGGAGNDSIAAGVREDTVYGGDGNDTITGEGGDDTLYGGDDDDALYGGEGNDTLEGDDGADTLRGGAGADSMHGGSGLDFLDYSDSGAAVTVDLATGSASGGDADGDSFVGVDGIIGSAFGDSLTGFDAQDPTFTNVFFGGGGNDTMDGAGGNDTLFGGTDSDVLQGGTGNDLLYAGDDQDTFVIEDSFGTDTIYGGEGGTDSDTLDLSALGSGVTVTYTGNEQGTFADGTDTGTFFGIENIILADQDDDFDATSETLGVSLDGQGGADSITGGSGADTLSGGDGADRLDGGNGNDTLYGGAGADTLEGGGGGLSDDLVYGGSGDDVFAVNFGSNTLFGGDDADTFGVGFGTDTIYGGSGGDDRDTLSGATPDDALTVTITGSESGTFADTDGDFGSFEDIEIFELTSKADTVLGSGATSDVTILAGDGADSIALGSGDDSVDAGAGNDTVSGGAGNDTLTGGAGDDTFAVTAGGGDDTITDFASGDRVDTSGVTDAGNVLTNQDGTVTADEVTVTGGGGTEQVLTFPNGETLTVPDGTVDTSTTATQFASLVAMGVPPCFAPGTRILTPMGEVPVENLKVGDLVITADQGPQPLRWIGLRQVTFGPENTRSDKDKPVEIKAGALGNGLPKRTLIVSPQHRMVLRGAVIAETFSTPEVFAIAKALTGLPDVRRMNGKREIAYFALLFDRHEVIFAEGAKTESFRPGPVALASFAPKHRAEIFRIYPGLADDPETALGPPARYIPKRREIEELLARMRRTTNQGTGKQSDLDWCSTPTGVLAYADTMNTVAEQWVTTDGKF